MEPDTTVFRGRGLPIDARVQRVPGHRHHRHPQLPGGHFSPGTRPLSRQSPSGVGRGEYCRPAGGDTPLVADAVRRYERAASATLRPMGGTVVSIKNDWATVFAS
jgi:hypothetical protein